MRSTRTYAILPVSGSAYLEIRKALDQAGYGEHAFHGTASDEVIDMHGIALQWNGMCSAGLHGLDRPDQACDLCPPLPTVG